VTQARGSIEREASSIEPLTAALASFRNAGPGEGPGPHYGVEVIPGSRWREDAGPTTAISPSGGPFGAQPPSLYLAPQDKLYYHATHGK